MLYALQNEHTKVSLHIRCYGCVRESVMTVNVPSGIGEDELAESSFLQHLAYRCSHCQGFIGHLFAIKEAKSHE